MSESSEAKEMEIYLRPIVENKKYVDLSPQEVSKFVFMAFAYIQTFKIGVIDGELRIFLLNIKDKLSEIRKQENLKLNQKLIDKIDAFNRIAENNLHLIGGKSRRYKKSRKLRRKRTRRNKTKYSKRRVIS
jgi:hypothetical protein